MARKPVDKSPSILTLSPEAAIAGGEIRIHGKGFATGSHPRVLLGDVPAPLIVGCWWMMSVPIAAWTVAGMPRRPA